MPDSPPPASLPEPSSSLTKIEKRVPDGVAEGSRKRQKISTACTTCQKAKVKCDGNQPCGKCQRMTVQCIYLQDGRRALVKLDNNRYREDAQLLNDLLQAVRDLDDERTSQLIRLMRSNAGPEEVKLRITEELNTIQATAGLRLLQDPIELDFRDRNLYRKDALRIQRLIDSPPYQVSCSPWTTVTQDDELASHLISLWLTWDKPYYNWMDEHLFLREMQGGNITSDYCSPFLVNCILAWACPYSDYYEARTRDGAISVLMQAFIDEAKRHLEQDAINPPTLPTVQGLAFLCLMVSLAGQDRVGYQVLLQTIAACEELERSPPRTTGDEEEAQLLSRTVDHTCWGVFNVTSAFFTSFMKPQIMRRPKCRPPRLSRENDSWTPYPRPGDSIPSYNAELFQVQCDYTIISVSLGQLLFNDSTAISVSLQEAKVIQLHDQLLETLASIPEYLQLREGAPASILAHHFWLQVIILRMFLPLQTPDHEPHKVDQARSICTQTALRVAQICQLYMRSYGSELMVNMIAQPIVLALCTLLDANPSELYYSEITTLFMCLRTMSGRWPMLMGVFRMIQHYAKQVKYNLPVDADRLLADFDDDWNRRQTRKFASVYPVVAAHKSLLDTGDVKDMSRFLEQMENLELGAV